MVRHDMSRLFAESFVSAPDIARDQMICSAGFVAMLSNMIDDVCQICGALGVRLPGLPLSFSLNYVDSNQSVNGSRQRMASVPTHAGSPAPLLQCYAAHLLLFLFSNVVRRDIGSWCAIHESYVGWPNDGFTQAHHCVRTRFDNNRFSFPGFNSWCALVGIHH